MNQGSMSAKRLAEDRRLDLGLLASHEGTNVQAVIDACATGALAGAVRVVISNNSESMVLSRARQAGLSCYHLSSHMHPNPDALDEAILDALRRHGVNLVVLAGYMKKLGPRTLQAYANRILNIHPALLPKHGGKGMYGERVHQAVLAARERETGVSIHIVSGEYDAGPVIAQCRVPVMVDDTVDTLRNRVLQREHTFLVETLREVSRGNLLDLGIREPGQGSPPN